MKSPRDNPRRDSFKSAGYNLLAGGIELLTGGFSSSWTLFADTAHNLGDSVAYGINATTSEKDKRVHNKWRKRAATLVCAGALAIGVKSGYEAMDTDAKRPEPVVPAAALAAGAISLRVHRNMRHHGHLHGGYADNAKHAEWDAYCAPITIAATALASAGIPHIDSIGGVAVSIITIWANNPLRID